MMLSSNCAASAEGMDDTPVSRDATTLSEPAIDEVNVARLSDDRS